MKKVPVIIYRNNSVKKNLITADNMQCTVCANLSPILLLDGFVIGFDTMR